jgi:deazaflavin-dependent oxidoreductase (nitroreductase family)
MANWKYFSKVHKMAYRLSNGRIGSRMAGVDVALVSITGRKTGQVRTTPIACYSHGDSVAVSASNNGLDRHPMWYLNLKVNPEVIVQFKSDRYKAEAVELVGEERGNLWQTVIEINPLQAKHQKHTSRVIPLVWFKRL